MMQASFAPLDCSAVTRSLQQHLAMYRSKPATYQAVMANDLLAIWQGQHDRLLDVGGGTGVIAQLMADHFPVGTVDAVDVVDRFCKTLSVRTHVYDGTTLPFADASFDAATFNNVIHHIPVEVRARVFQEVRRVVRGPVYIKDHLSTGKADDLRLWAMDAIGNIPFGGMVEANYLSATDWQQLAKAGGYRLAAQDRGQYRRGVYDWIFPNRLETVMRWEPA